MDKKFFAKYVKGQAEQYMLNHPTAIPEEVINGTVSIMQVIAAPNVFGHQPKNIFYGSFPKGLVLQIATDLYRSTPNRWWWGRNESYLREVQKVPVDINIQLGVRVSAEFREEITLYVKQVYNPDRAFGGESRIHPRYFGEGKLGYQKRRDWVKSKAKSLFNRKDGNAQATQGTAGHERLNHPYEGIVADLNIVYVIQNQYITVPQFNHLTITERYLFFNQATLEQVAHLEKKCDLNLSLEELTAFIKNNVLIKFGDSPEITGMLHALISSMIKLVKDDKELIKNTQDAELSASSLYRIGSSIDLSGFDISINTAPFGMTLLQGQYLQDVANRVGGTSGLKQALIYLKQDGASTDIIDTIIQRIDALG